MREITGSASSSAPNSALLRRTLIFGSPGAFIHLGAEIGYDSSRHKPATRSDVACAEFAGSNQTQRRNGGTNRVSLLAGMNPQSSTDVFLPMSTGVVECRRAKPFHGANPEEPEGDSRLPVRQLTP